MFKSLIGAGALALLSSTALGGTYLVTVTNTMSEELLAPILVTDASNDRQIFAGGYVTPEAEEMILTGDPTALARRIARHARPGHRANVASGTDGPPGVLLAPGKSLSFIIETEADKLRVISMVAPTAVPDNFVTALVDLGGGMMRDEMMDDGMAGDDMMQDEMAGDDMMKDEMAEGGMAGGDAMMGGQLGMPVALARFDIGNDEGSGEITGIPGAFATVTIVKRN